MAKLSPAYRHKKTRGLAVVTLTDSLTGERRDVYLGDFGSDESRQRYHAVLAGWESRGRRLVDHALPGGSQVDPITGQPQSPEPATAAQPDRRVTAPDGVLVCQLILGYWRYCEARYQAGQGGTLSDTRQTLKLLRAVYGQTPAAMFGPKCLKHVQLTMIEKGWCRGTANKRLGIIRRMFKWALSEELIEPSVYHALEAVEGLRRGEHGVEEREKIHAVAEADVYVTLEHLSPPVAAMVRLQLLTGMRPGEVLIMRPIDIDATGNVWRYTPKAHKTQHHDIDRHIYLGPEAQKIAQPWLARPTLQSWCFCPREGGTKAAATATKDRYEINAYRRAITRGCDRAFPPPEPLACRRMAAQGRKHTQWETTAQWRNRLGPDRWAELERWRQDHRWSPNQLRHTAATNLRKEFGIEAARLILGHTTAGTTMIYAEADAAKAQDIMARVG